MSTSIDSFAQSQSQSQDSKTFTTQSQEEVFDSPSALCDIAAAYKNHHNLENQIIYQCFTTVRYALRFWKGLELALRQEQEKYIAALNANAARLAQSSLHRSSLSDELKINEDLERTKAMDHRMKPLTVGLIGCGRVGLKVVNALITSGLIPPNRISVSTRRPNLPPLRLLSQSGVAVYFDNPWLVSQCDLVILACLPHQAQQVGSSITHARDEAAAIQTYTPLESTSSQNRDDSVEITGLQTDSNNKNNNNSDLAFLNSSNNRTMTLSSIAEDGNGDRDTGEDNKNNSNINSNHNGGNTTKSRLFECMLFSILSYAPAAGIKQLFGMDSVANTVIIPKLGRLLAPNSALASNSQQTESLFQEFDEKMNNMGQEVVNMVQRYAGSIKEGAYKHVVEHVVRSTQSVLFEELKQGANTEWVFDYRKLEPFSLA